MKLTENEKRDVVRLIEEGKVLPEKYRFLLFDKSNQVELTWNGKSNEISNVALPFQVIEQIDEPRNENVKLAQGSFDFASGRQIFGWSNKLIWGDNKYILSSLKNGPMYDEIKKEGGIKLIYIDPPFDVGADFSTEVEIGDNSYEKKPNVLEQFAYRDTWGMGQDSFLSMIYERLLIMKDLLADNGSIFVHCDQRVNANIKLIMNEIFGEENFRNEIVWKRTHANNNVSVNYGTITDFIYYFSKSKDFIWNQQYITRDDKKIEKDFPNIDKDGRRWASINLASPAKRPNLVFPYTASNGITYQPHINGWRTDKAGLEKLDKEGRLHFPIKEDGRLRRKQFANESIGLKVQNLWDDFSALSSHDSERVGYPTQKPEKLIKRIIESTTNEGDLIADFFSGSGSTAAIAEKINRKWICSDLGKFAIHTCRKRMITVQRELKKQDKSWRAFEVLNLGKYQIQHYIYDGKTERDEIKKQQRIKKEKDFEKLILEAYKAKSISGFLTIQGKKGNDFVSLGPINQSLSRNHVEEVIAECLKNNITSVDILGFEYEMGLFPTIQEEAKIKGLKLSYKQIPMEVFDKRAVAKDQVVFHDVAYIEFKPHFKGKKLSLELVDFSVFYNEDNLNLDENLKNGKSKIVVENGEIVEKKKDKNGIISEKILTKNWYDWVDYWSVDFDYESKPEIIKFKTESGKIEEEWTGNYVFENEWQSFRSSKEQKLQLHSSEREILSKKTKVAVKVVDIFGNDTMKVVEFNI